MNKIDRMLEELCPNGVEYKRFEACCRYIRGVTYNKGQEAKPGDQNTKKVLRANNITVGFNILNFSDVKEVKQEVRVREEQKLKKGDILICAGSGSKEHVGKVAYIFDDLDYTFGGFMAVIRCSEILNSRYLFHFLTSGSFSDYLKVSIDSSTINNLNVGVMNPLEIPIPPLAVQEEIVRILDTFSAQAAELQAELQARREQYEYYRDKLLSFSNIYSGKFGSGSLDEDE